MEEAVSLAYQLEGAKQKKRELDTHIKKLEQQLLNTEELAQQKLLLSNEGGQKTISGISVEIKRDHVWDQDLLAGLLSDMPKEDWPHFITQQTTYKVDYRSFESFAMANPDDPTVKKLHGAHSIKLGNFRVKENDEQLGLDISEHGEDAYGEETGSPTLM